VSRQSHRFIVMSLSPSPPVVIDSEKEFEVEEVLDSKFMRNYLFYLILPSPRLDLFDHHFHHLHHVDLPANLVPANLAPSPVRSNMFYIASETSP